jgi:hypothetical protein
MAIAIDRPHLKRVSWGALFAGLFVGIASWLLLLALGAGVGLAAFDPSSGGSALKSLGIGVGIWGVIAAIIAYFFSGWLTSRLSTAGDRTEGTLHGVALWGLMLVASIWLTMMALGGAASGAAGLANSAAQAMPEQQKQQLTQDLQRQGRQAQREVQRGQQTGENQQKAEQAGETATNVSTGASWGFFVYALLTLLAAAIGGRLGVPHDRTTPIVHEETAPIPPGRPLSPQRA